MYATWVNTEIADSIALQRAQHATRPRLGSVSSNLQLGYGGLHQIFMHLYYFRVALHTFAALPLYLYCVLYITYSLVQNIKDTNISWSRQCYTSHTLTLCGCVDVVVATAAEDVCRLCWWPAVAVPALLPSGHCTFLCKTQFVKWILTRKHGHTLTVPCCHTANWETTQD